MQVLDDAKQSWPQPISESIIMECLLSYRDSIKYVPLSICACCGAEDRLRTGANIPLDSLPHLDVLRVTNQYILDHTPRSRWC